MISFTLCCTRLAPVYISRASAFLFQHKSIQATAMERVGYRYRDPWATWSAQAYYASTKTANKKGNKNVGIMPKTPTPYSSSPYVPVIGIEIHTQLATASKAYCGCSATILMHKQPQDQNQSHSHSQSQSDSDSKDPNDVLRPNTNVCEVCMGYPGSLPVLNKKVVELAVKLGKALNCTVNKKSAFDRKNYYYPDTPKNYQITQNRRPIAENGFVILPSGKRVGITRAHIEEDSGRLFHHNSSSSSSYSLVDFNRAGIPLVEIVSEPVLQSGMEAAELGQEIQRIIRYIGVSDGDMQHGSMRFDVNVSLTERQPPEGANGVGIQISTSSLTNNDNDNADANTATADTNRASVLPPRRMGTKVELKNLNSFANIQKAVDYEIQRQTKRLNDGNRVVLETRKWDELKQKTISLRVKEEIADYRFFPEPDLPPLVLQEDDIQRWVQQLPELPNQKRQRFLQVYKIPPPDVLLLTADLEKANFYEQVVSFNVDPKKAANWMNQEITAYLNTNKTSLPQSKLKPEDLADMMTMIDEGTITGKIAKTVIQILLEQGGPAAQIVQERNLYVIRDPEAVKIIVEKVASNHPEKVAAYKKGNVKLSSFFAGQVMKETDGRADPTLLNSIISQVLESHW